MINVAVRRYAASLAGAWLLGSGLCACSGRTPAVIASPPPTLAPAAAPSVVRPSPPAIAASDPRPSGSGALTLEDAVALALSSNPGLAAVRQDLDAKDAAIPQARLRPDPELSAQVEDFAGSGTRQGFDVAQSTLLLSQTFETGGKRELRGRAAELDREVAFHGLDAAALDLIASVKSAFVSALAAQERAALARQALGLSEEIRRQAERQLSAGGGSATELSQTRIEEERVRLNLNRNEGDLQAARNTLVAFWGGDGALAFTLAGTLAESPRELLPEAKADPVDAKLLALHAEVEAARIALAAEEAGRFPDLTLGAGPRYFDDRNDVAAVVEVSLPFPLPARSRAGAAAAGARLAAAESRLRQAANDAKAGLASARLTLAQATRRSEDLRSRLIPIAEQLLTQTRREREQGRMHETDVLSAQSSLLQLRGERIDALEQMRLAAIRVERLTGSASAARSER